MPERVGQLLGLLMGLLVCCTQKPKGPKSTAIESYTFYSIYLKQFCTDLV